MGRAEVGEGAGAASIDRYPGAGTGSQGPALLLQDIFSQMALSSWHLKRGWQVNYLGTGVGRPFVAAQGHHQEPGHMRLSPVSATITFLCL